jgi:S1-C subfamily serine protease
MRRPIAAFAAAVVVVLAGALPSTQAQTLTTPQLVRAVSPSIVRIEIEGPVQETMTTGEGANAKSEPVTRYKVYFGTGFVIDDAGHVVTNNHVIHPANVKWQGESRLTVEMPKEFNAHPASFASKAEEDAYRQLTVHNGRCYAPHATVVGFDEAADLAVLQIPAPLLKPLKFARPEEIEVGEDVVAVGYALDLAGGPTVTKGVSAPSAAACPPPTPKSAT